MDNQVRTHRRNKAVPSLDKNHHHQSHLSFGRSSLDQNYNGPLTLRLSNDNSFQPEIFVPSSSFSTNYQGPPTLQYKKEIQKPAKASTLKDNLRQLEQKLAKARWQLQLHKKNKNIQPNSSSRKNLSPSTQNILDLFTCQETEQDQSTMSISHRNKMMSIKSKQKLNNSPRIKEYYIGSLIKGISGGCSIALEHLSNALAISKQAVCLQIPSVFSIYDSKINLPKLISQKRKKTLIIELNQTLLLVKAQQTTSDDIRIGKKGDQLAFISLRPYAISFLKKICTVFQIVVFSILTQNIVDSILEQIDPQKKLVTHRISKTGCITLKNGFLAKDLRILNRSLKDTVIVDSDPQGYSIQLDNAIPILPYRGGDDRQLVDLQRYLIREILPSADVRQVNRQVFKLSNYWQHEQQVELVKQLYLRQEKYY